jgi:O-antigen ligase
MIAISVLLLYAELIKATRPSSRAIVDHLLSTLLFIVMLMEFILFRQAATSTFFLMTVISFVDVVGGFSVTIRSAQRDINVDGSSNIQRL